MGTLQASIVSSGGSYMNYFHHDSAFETLFTNIFFVPSGTSAAISSDISGSERASSWNEITSVQMSNL